MTEIQPFIFPTTGQQIRAVMVDGEPWFVAADVCRVLGLTNSTMALRALEPDEKGLSLIETPGGPQSVSIVNESGMYALIVRSDKPNAKPFRRWVTGDVLPTIRKTGRFELVPQFQIPKSYAEALELAASQARELEAKDVEIQQQRAALDWAEPRAAYVDKFVDGAGDATTVRDLAKQVGVPEGKLRPWMVERHLIYVIKTNGGNEYRPRAELGPRRNWFVLRDQADAPRYHNGQMRKTLYITPAGKTGIEALLVKYPILGQGELDIEAS